MRIELTSDEHKYIMAISHLAEGPEKRVDTIESDVAQKAEIEQSKEQDIKDALEEGGLIRFDEGSATKEFIYLEKAGEKYCESHSKG